MEDRFPIQNILHEFSRVSIFVEGYSDKSLFLSQELEFSLPSLNDSLTYYQYRVTSLSGLFMGLPLQYFEMWHTHGRHHLLHCSVDKVMTPGAAHISGGISFL